MPQSPTIAGLPREEIIEVEVLRKKNEPIIVTFRTKTAQKTLPIDDPELESERLALDYLKRLAESSNAESVKCSFTEEE